MLFEQLLRLSRQCLRLRGTRSRHGYEQAGFGGRGRVRPDTISAHRIS